MKPTYDPDKPTGWPRPKGAGTPEDPWDGEIPEEEPEEDDLTTEDYVNWYQDGKQVLIVDESEDWKTEVQAFMNRNQFWPNVWWISDHGNAHLLSLKED